jgi:hypothetical protein
VPAILAGVVVTYISFEIFGIAVAVIGVAVAAEAWRTRPPKWHIQAVEPADAVLVLPRENQAPERRRPTI